MDNAITHYHYHLQDKHYFLPMDLFFHNLGQVYILILQFVLFLFILSLFIPFLFILSIPKFQVEVHNYQNHPCITF